MRNKIMVLVGVVGVLIMVSTVNNDNIKGYYTVWDIFVRLTIGLIFMGISIALYERS